MVLFETLVIIFIVSSFIISGIIFATIRTAGSRIFNFCGAMFILLFGICKIFYYILDFVRYDIIFKSIGAIIGIISLIFLLFAIEKEVFTESKFLFTIAGLVVLTLYFIPFPTIINDFVHTLVIAILTPVVPCLYLYIAIKGEGESRKFAIIYFCGTLLFILGNVCRLPAFKEVTLLYFILSPIFYIISVYLVGYAVSKQGQTKI